MAVASRDGKHTVASAILTPGEPCDIAGNTWLNCLHTNGRYRIPVRAARTVRQRFYFLEESLDALTRRLRRDMEALR